MADMNILGWRIRSANKKFAEPEREEVIPSPIAPQRPDGALEVEAWDTGSGSFDVRRYNQDVFNFKSDQDRIIRYRKMAQNADVDEAINYIINDAITVDDTKPPVTVRLDNIQLPAKTKKTITEEFEYILWLMNFNRDAYEIFRDWYIDSTIYYHPILDNAKNGIVELRRIDPLQIKKVRELLKEKTANNLEIVKGIREYYVYRQTKGLTNAAQPTTGIYSQSGFSFQSIAVPTNMIVSVNSGVLSEDKTVVLGHLHKAIKPLNNLVSVENALIIYRLSRAPERRVFYIDVGNLPKTKAEQAVRDMMNNYKNKMVYDAYTGEVDSMNRHMTMIEDFWLPRRGDKGTQVETLPGGQNLGEITDIAYFQKKLYKSLNVPTGRLEDQTINIGRVAEMTRDELKFSKFIDRLRKRFADVFLQLLRIQLVAKNIVTQEEFDEIREHIQFDFLQDFYIAEQKEFDLLTERIRVAGEAEGLVGKYFTREWIGKNVLKQSDEEFKEQQKKIAVEREVAKKNGLPYGDMQPPAPGFEDPNAPMGAPAGGASGNPVEEGAISDAEGQSILSGINSRLSSGKTTEMVRDEMGLDQIYMGGNNQATGFTIGGETYKKGGA